MSHSSLAGTCYSRGHKLPSWGEGFIMLSCRIASDALCNKSLLTWVFL